MYEKIEQQFKKVGIFDHDVINNIVTNLEENCNATFEINLENWDLIELLEYNTPLNVNTHLLSADENLYRVNLSC